MAGASRETAIKEEERSPSLSIRLHAPLLQRTSGPGCVGAGSSANRRSVGASLKMVMRLERLPEHPLQKLLRDFSNRAVFPPR